MKISTYSIYGFMGNSFFISHQTKVCDEILGKMDKNKEGKLSA